MAKKAKGESLSARFKQLFTEHPDWLDLEKNDPIFDHWRQATGAAMDKRTRGVMANVKSRLRQKLRGGAGTFYERVQGNDVYNAALNPPFAYIPSANNVYFSNPNTSPNTRIPPLARMLAGNVAFSGRPPA